MSGSNSKLWFRWLLLALIVVSSASAVFAQVRRDMIVVGSSTVYPFVSFVAEYFGLLHAHPSPRVESTGTGGGFKSFCQGVGLNFPDINNASRAIKASEVELCRAHGIEHIFELFIGLDSIVLVVHPDSALKNMTIEQIYLALARWVPDEQGQKMIDNPHHHYDDIDPQLPHLPIRVLGPPPTSGTRDSFVELVLEKACAKHPLIAALTDKAAKKRHCRTVREDGAFIEAGENDNLILRKVSDADPGTMGLTGFNFYIQNQDLVRALRVDGVRPSHHTIAAHTYPIARPLFVYIKGEHLDLTPGLTEFVELLISDFILGKRGRLHDLGLIPPSDKLRAQTARRWQQEQQRVFGAALNRPASSGARR